MTGSFIVNTPKSSMHALAFQGIMIADCHAQLRDMLRRKFGDAHALLFAEPVANAADSSVDWYTPLQGAIRPLASLPPEEQDALRASLAHMAQEIRAFAEELKRSPESIKAARGCVLELALRYPDEAALYVAGGQPVLTCWGYGPGTPGAEPQDLSRLTRLITAAPAAHAGPAAPPAAPPAPEPARGASWLWWLLPLLLALLLLALLCTSFGTWKPLSGLALFHAPALPFSSISTPELEARQRENAALEADIDALRAKVETHAAQCRPEQPAPPAQPAIREELVIPEKTQDLAFLHGRWRCETGLVNSRTNDPIVVEFQFDAQGRGRGTVYEKDDQCRGEAQATLDGEVLHITLGQQQCGKDETYTRQTIDCRNDNGAAQCQGRNEDGTAWDAQFFRLAR